MIINQIFTNKTINWHKIGISIMRELDISSAQMFIDVQQIKIRFFA
jgi:hypothetical protein